MSRKPAISIHSLVELSHQCDEFLHGRWVEGAAVDLLFRDHYSVAADQLDTDAKRAKVLAWAAQHYILQSEESVGARRRELVHYLSRSISAAKQRDGGDNAMPEYENKTRVDLLKRFLAGERTHWKQNLLNIEHVELLKSSGAKKQFSRDVMDERSILIPANRLSSHAPPAESKTYIPHASMAVGSTFVTNKAEIIEDTLGEGGDLLPHVSLDAAYSATTPDGFVVAIADGCGGHHDEVEDSAIRRAAKFNTKAAARYLTTYTAEELADADRRTRFFDRVALETQRKNPHHAIAASATLIAARGVSVGDGMIQFFGVGVGDCALVGYNPRTQEVFHFFDGCQNAWGTASVPGARTKPEERYFCQNIPADTIILPLTDGVTDGLECDVVEEGDLRLARVNSDRLRDILVPLGPDATASQCLASITDAICAKGEAVRLAAKEAAPELAGIMSRQREFKDKLETLQQTQQALEVKATEEGRELMDELKVYDNFVASGDFDTENARMETEAKRAEELHCQYGDDVTAMALCPAKLDGYFGAGSQTLFKPKVERVAAASGGAHDAMLAPVDDPISVTKHKKYCGSTRITF